MPLDARARADATLDATLWRTLRYFAYYRLIVAGMFLAMQHWLPRDLSLGSQHPQGFAWSAALYLAGGIAALAVLQRWRERFNLQLTLQVMFDIAMLTALLYSSGGAKSGLATMLLVVLVGAGLVGQGRLVLFYAALATLALLGEQIWRILSLGGNLDELFRTGITSIACFGSAIAARLLAQRVVANEDLARRRGWELADQQRINERVIRDMQEGVLVVDVASRVRQANPQAWALLGLAAATQARTELLAHFSAELAAELIKRRSLGAESYLLLRPAASGKTLFVRFLPPGDGGLVLIFIKDYAQLQQEAQQLKLAALGRLTANLAHEIRNPLASISQAAELLGEAPASPAAPRLTAMIGDNVGRLNRLVSAVTELGRRDRAVPERIELQPFLVALVDELALQSPAQARRVSIDLPAAATVCFDRSHLHRVCTNLLGNALAYASAAPAAVRIGLAADAGSAVDRLDISFVDDGPGIAAEEREKIFEPFFTQRPGGTGLGLYIARELCEANSARLSVAANAPGGHFCLSCATRCTRAESARQETPP